MVAAVTVDLGAWYREARTRIGVLVSDDVGDLASPATPSWTVHDVVAHLAGVAEDARNGNMAGATTDPWTAAQVERGRGKSIAQLLAQWADDAGLVEAFLSTPEGADSSWRAVLDIHTHEADLCTALGQPVALPAEFLAWMRPRMLDPFHATVAAAGVPPVAVVASDLDVFRGRLGRRTPAEVRAYLHPIDPAASLDPHLDTYLDAWFIFGRAESSLAE
jgi:uncharacterized protein (TIGR03083 family)